MSDEKNLWEDFLEGAKRGDTGGATTQSTLFVVGNPQNGKSSIMKHWKDRVTSDTNIPEYLLDFSYCNVIDRYDPDTADDALISRMGIWQLDDEAHANLLPTLTKDAKRVGFVITLDLSDPADIEVSLKKWLEVYKSTSEGLLKDEKMRNEYRHKISQYVQTFEDATKKLEKVEIKIVEEEYDGTGDDGKEEGKEGKEGKEEEKKEDEKEEKEEESEIFIETPIDPDVPAQNYGIPLFVVGMKADFFEKLNAIGANDKFEFITHKLRRTCLEWGATLLFTSAAGDGVNAQLFVDQVYHRLFNFPLLHPPKVVGSASDYAIHIPAGYDKLSLLELSQLKWDESTDLSRVFSADSNPRKKGAKEKKAQQIIAKSDEEFFRSCQEQLKTGKRREDPNMSKSANKKKKEKAVKSFFKSLLSKE